METERTSAQASDRCMDLQKEVAGTILMKITCYDDRVARGVLQSLYLKQKFEFIGLDQAVLSLEEILDQAGVIREDTDHRYLGKRRCRRSWTGDQEVLTDFDGPWYEPRSVRKSGKCRRFYIRVYSRSWSSLQGEVRAGNQRVCFRSAMELMRMIHQNLLETMPQKYPPGETGAVSDRVS